MITDSKEKAEKGAFDWDIKAINRSDYEIYLDIFSQNKLMKMLFSKAVLDKLPQKNLTIAGNQNQTDAMVDSQKRFSVPSYYFPTVKLAIRKLIKIVQKEIEGDLKLLTKEIKSTEFIRDDQNPEIWRIRVVVEGQYVDLR